MSGIGSASEPRLVAFDSKATHCPSGLMVALSLSPLPSAPPPEATLTRLSETSVGPGPSWARKTSAELLLSPSTRLGAREVKTTLRPSSLMLRWLQLPDVAVPGAQDVVLPVGSWFRSAPPVATLTRSIVPGAGAAWARGPETPARRPSASTSPTGRGRRRDPEDRGCLMLRRPLSEFSPRERHRGATRTEGGTTDSG